MECTFAVVFLFCTSLALAQVPPYYGRVGVPGGAYVGVPILVQNYDLNPDGSYTFNYESADGSARDEAGVVKGVGPEGPFLGVQGNYRYVSPDGPPVAVSYIADENGYQPSGDNVHPSIQKAVAYQVAEAQANPAVRGGPAVPGYYGNPFRRY